MIRRCTSRSSSRCRRGSRGKDAVTRVAGLETRASLPLAHEMVRVLLTLALRPKRRSKAAAGRGSTVRVISVRLDIPTAQLIASDAVVAENADLETLLLAVD